MRAAALSRCGNVGCIEAFASFGAILRKLGIEEDTLCVTRLDDPATPTIASMVRNAASDVGELVAMLVRRSRLHRRLTRGGKTPVAT